MFEIDEEARSEIELSLVEYEKQIGLPTNKKVNQPEALMLNIADLKKKDPEELLEIEYEILRYSTYLQRVINDHYKWERWGVGMLDQLTSNYLPEVDGSYGWSEKLLIARNQPQLCKQLNDFIRDNRMKLDTLRDIPKKIDGMAAIIRDIRFLAMKREKTYE
jgi:hypothetical protein